LRPRCGCESRRLAALSLSGGRTDSTFDPVIVRSITSAERGLPGSPGPFFRASPGAAMAGTLPRIRTRFPTMAAILLALFPVLLVYDVPLALVALTLAVVLLYRRA